MPTGPTVQFIPKCKDAFVIEENGERVAEIIVSIENSQMLVFHTGVNPLQKGKSLGTKLVEGMADYARQHQLQVEPHCPFVKAQFKDNPDKFGDLAVKAFENCK